jgi:hypothetical protein
MCESINSQLITISSGIPQKNTPFSLINKSFKDKLSQKGVKRVANQILWKKSQRKILRNSVKMCYLFDLMLVFDY